MTLPVTAIMTTGTAAVDDLYDKKARKRASVNAWRKANRERVLSVAAAWRKNNLDKNRKYYAHRCEQLTASYVRNQLRLQGFTEITDELITVKTEQLAIKRSLCQLKNTIKEVTQ